MPRNMLEWRTLPRSIRLETPEVALDVWRTCHIPNPLNALEPATHPYRWTAFDRVSGCYLGSGREVSQDAACEAAVLAGKL